jgi:uncharacterized protein YoxC
MCYKQNIFLCIDIAKNGCSDYNSNRFIITGYCWFSNQIRTDHRLRGFFMNSLFIGLITLAVFVLTGFIIYLILELKKTINSVKLSMESIEKVIIPTVEELQMTLKSVRKITDDVGVVTEEVKGLSGSIREIRENVKYVSEAVSAITKNSVVQVSGVKAGVKAGFEYFIKNLFAQGQQDH